VLSSVARRLTGLIQDLSGGAFRLEVALALAGRNLVTPRTTSDGNRSVFDFWKPFAHVPS
jgi:hypothetical protein